VVDYSCGEEHAAYVDNKGGVFTWGCGLNGQLGHGNTNSYFIPTKVPLDFKASKVSCGGSHTAIVSEDN